MIYDYVTILKPEMVKIAESARIDDFVKIEGGQGVSIGEGVHVSSFCHLNIGGGRLHVGDYVALTSGVKIHTGSNTAEGQSMSSAAPPEMQVIERSKVTIGDFAFIGSGAQILMGITVGEYAVVGAGAVVTEDVPAWTVWMGIPARHVGMRVRLKNGKYGISYLPKQRELADQLADLMEATYP